MPLAMFYVVAGLIVFSIYTRLQVTALRRRLNLVASAICHARDSSGQLLLNEDVRALLW